MKKPISEMSPEECLDESVFLRIKYLIEKARKMQKAATAATNIVFDQLDDMCIDLDDIPTNAENAGTLKEAICCYIDYGEYSVAGIMKELREAYKTKEERACTET